MNLHAAPPGALCRAAGAALALLGALVIVPGSVRAQGQPSGTTGKTTTQPQVAQAKPAGGARGKTTTVSSAKPKPGAKPGTTTGAGGTRNAAAAVGGAARKPARGAAVGGPLTAADSVAAEARDVASVAVVAALVRGRGGEMRFCYEQMGLKANASLEGDVTISFSLTPAGLVAAGIFDSVWSAERDGAEVDACLLKRLRAWRFPAEGVGGSARRATGAHEFTFRFAP
ncbi:MAG: AgmX/PglI C-terminal domain-containing protein [Gemmatimonadaceae bacterium]